MEENIGYWNFDRERVLITCTSLGMILDCDFFDVVVGGVLLLVLRLEIVGLWV